MRDGFVCDVFGWHLCVVAACEVDEGALVAHAVAVVGSREHSDALAIVVDLVTVVFHLQNTQSKLLVSTHFHVT